MGYKVCLEKNTDILSMIYSISNCSMINSLIKDLIDREGVTNFFCNDDGSYSFSLITNKCEKVYILFRSDNIFISNNLDGIRQQVIYRKEDYGVSIRNRVCSKVDRTNYSQNSCVESNTIYDNDDNLVINEIVKKFYLDSDDLDMQQKIKNMPYENYKVISNDYKIGDKFVRTVFTDYIYNSNLNKRRYFSCDYVLGMLGDGNISMNIKPKYCLISEDEFMSCYSDYMYDNDKKFVKTL